MPRLRRERRYQRRRGDAIKIPAGVAEGMQLSHGRQRQCRCPGRDSRRPVVQIEEIKHDRLERDGNNLLYEHYHQLSQMQPWDARSKSPLSTEKSRSKIEPGTQSGKILRLRGKGLAQRQSYEGRGDLLVSLSFGPRRTLQRKKKRSFKTG